MLTFNDKETLSLEKKVCFPRSKLLSLQSINSNLSKKGIINVRPPLTCLLNLPALNMTANSSSSIRFRLKKPKTTKIKKINKDILICKYINLC